MKQSTIKKREKQLLHLLKLAIEHTNEGVLITNANLNPPGPKIVYVNKALCEMTGYTKNEFLGKSPRLLQGPRSNDILLDKISKKLHTGKSYYGYVINYRKDGSEMYMELNIAPIWSEKNKISHYISIQRDITASLKIEIEKNEVLGEFDHEIKTHLTTIKGYLQLLEKKSLNSKFTQYIQSADREIDKILKLLLNIRDTRNNQTNNTIMQVGRFDIDAIITQTIKNVKVTSNSHKIARRGKVNQKMQVDAFRISQVLEHLLKNVIKYSPNSDTVIVRAKKDLKNIVINIEDDGRGISPEKQEKIFHRFYLSGNAKGEVDSGNGFGLYLASEIVKAHGGIMNVQSTLGKGTIFSITLPLNNKNIKKNINELFNNISNENNHISTSIPASLLNNHLTFEKIN
jgi:PAS domain S-box-containing protein